MIQSDGLRECPTVVIMLQNLLRAVRLFFRSLLLLKTCLRLFIRYIGNRTNVLTIDSNSERFFFKSMAVTCRTIFLSHKFSEMFPGKIRRRLPIPACNIVHNAFKMNHVVMNLTKIIHIAETNFFLATSV